MHDWLLWSRRWSCLSIHLSMGTWSSKRKIPQSAQMHGRAWMFVYATRRDLPGWFKVRFCPPTISWKFAHHTFDRIWFKKMADSSFPLSRFPLSCFHINSLVIFSSDPNMKLPVYHYKGRISMANQILAYPLFEILLNNPQFWNHAEGPEWVPE